MTTSPKQQSSNPPTSSEKRNPQPSPASTETPKSEDAQSDALVPGPEQADPKDLPKNGNFSERFAGKSK